MDINKIHPDHRKAFSQALVSPLFSKEAKESLYDFYCELDEYEPKDWTTVGTEIQKKPKREWHKVEQEKKLKKRDKTKKRKTWKEHLKEVEKKAKHS